jgi:hypothetical protein
MIGPFQVEWSAMALDDWMRLPYEAAQAVARAVRALAETWSGVVISTGPSEYMLFVGDHVVVLLADGSSPSRAVSSNGFPRRACRAEMALLSDQRPEPGDVPLRKCRGTTPGRPRTIRCSVEPGDFDEHGFFSAIADSSARALLIGRRAMIALGAPVLTADYDFWIHIDDVELFNGAVASFGLHPNRTPDEARARGRYVLENDEHVDVLVARSIPTVDSIEVRFDGVWLRRMLVPYGENRMLSVPGYEDLILTKLFAARPKDLIDIDFIRAIRAAREAPP